jgi:hypothetical protein
MKLQALQDVAIYEFGLIPKQRNDGWSYWTDEGERRKPVRVLRVTQTEAGNVTEIKLPVSSLAAQKELFLPLPCTLDQIRAAIANEIQNSR